jgi:hypothetical protein
MTPIIYFICFNNLLLEWIKYEYFNIATSSKVEFIIIINQIYMTDFNFSGQVGQFHVVPYMPHVVNNVHFDYITSCLKSKQTYLIWF